MKDLLDKLTPGKKTKGIETRRTEKIGTGGKYDSLVTVKTRSISSKSTPQEIDEFNDSYTPYSLLSEIERKESIAREVLEKAGLPTHWNVTSTHKDSIEIGTASHYAAEALCLAFILKKSLEENNTKAAVYNALQFQSAIDTLVIKHWEYAARVGEAQLTSNTDSHKQHYDDDHEEWESIAKDRYFNDSVSDREKKQNKLAKYVAEQCSLKSASSVRTHFTNIGFIKKLKSTG